MAEFDVPFEVLRSAVESTHGHTGATMHLCELTDDGEKRIVLLSESDFNKGVANGSVTPILKTTRARLGKKNAAEDQTVVTIKVANGSLRTYDPGKADALFWTESAIEKFFFPYYQRVLPAAEFQKLRDDYYDPPSAKKPILAFVHYPPSIYDDGGLRRVPANRVQAGGDSFGIID